MEENEIKIGNDFANIILDKKYQSVDELRKNALKYAHSDFSPDFKERFCHIYAILNDAITCHQKGNIDMFNILMNNARLMALNNMLEYVDKGIYNKEREKYLKGESSYHINKE